MDKHNLTNIFDSFSKGAVELIVKANESYLKVADTFNFFPIYQAKSTSALLDIERATEHLKQISNKYNNEQTSKLLDVAFQNIQEMAGIKNILKRIEESSEIAGTKNILKRIEETSQPTNTLNILSEHTQEQKKLNKKLQLSINKSIASSFKATGNYLRQAMNEGL